LCGKNKEYKKQNPSTKEVKEAMHERRGGGVREGSESYFHGNQVIK
jgi:hypothetical protein